VADETRNLDVGLRITKEGDEGAFKETAAEVRDLEKETSKANPVLDALGGKLAGSKKEAKDAAEGFEQLAKGGGDVVGKLGSVAVVATSVAAAFTVGWEAGTKLRDVLNDITEGGFDEGVQNALTKLLRLNAGLDEGPAAAERYRNALNILAKNGIDATGKSAAEVDEILANLSRTKYDVAKATEAQAEADEKYAAKLGLSKKQLEETGTALGEFIQRYAAANTQLSKDDLAELFGKQIQQILDQSQRLKVEPPAAIAELARSWNIVGTEAAKAADAQKAAIDKIIAEIAGAKGRAQVPIEELGTALSEAIGKINFDALDTAGLDRAKEKYQEFIDRSIAAGKQIPADVADQAAALGVLVPAMNVAGGASLSLKEKQDDAAASSVEWTEKIDAQGKKTLELKQKMSEAGDAAKDAGSKVKEGAEQIADAGEAGGEAATGLGEAAAAADQLGQAGEKGGVGKLKADIEGIQGPAAAAATALGTLNDVDLTKVTLGLGGVVSMLDTILTKAPQAKAALDAIDQAGAG